MVFKKKTVEKEEPNSKKETKVKPSDEVVTEGNLCECGNPVATDIGQDKVCRNCIRTN